MEKCKTCTNKMVCICGDVLCSLSNSIKCNSLGHYHWNDQYICVTCWMKGRFIK